MLRYLSAVFVLAIAGCATPYQTETRLAGGFSDVQLDVNVFRVSFRGNGYTSPDRAEEMTLLRSADVTLRNGFTHFVIVDARSRVAHSTYTTPIQSTTTGTIRPTFGGSVAMAARTTITGGQTYGSAKPSSTNTIVCYNGKPDIAEMAYDARLVFDSLAKKYEVGSKAPCIRH